MSTYTPIASQTLGSAASSVTFSGIPQNFTDLRIVFTGLSTSSTPNIWVQFNGDTGTNYSNTTLAGNGTTAVSVRASNQTYGLMNAYGLSTSVIQNDYLDVMNYSNTTTFKSAIARFSEGGGVGATVNLWRSTSAITSISLIAGGLSFASGSTFNLYGIIAGTAKASGGTVTTDGTYFYHTFTSSGIFSASADLTADYLVLAGGSAGGSNNISSQGAGGGGAGGLRCTVTATGGGGSLESALSLIKNTNYTVTVGAGGSAVAGSSGANGSNSVFATVTSTGGGGGTGSNNVNGLTGGSGGGSPNGITAGSGTANQGYNGTQNSAFGGGGGGGGTGAIGASSGGFGGGNGGNGIASSITGSSVTRGGGGGGGAYAGGTQGTGGSGGGGNGGVSASKNGIAGTANLGAGGGGAGDSNGTGGNGGSGIVIIRYAV